MATEPTSPTITPALVTVLRNLTQKPDYAKTFFKDPATAAKTAGLSASETAIATKITPTAIDGLTRAAKAVGGGRADDNCTLVYAVAFALAFALFVALLDRPTTVER